MNYRTNVLGISTGLALLATVVLNALPNIPEKAIYAGWGVTLALFLAWVALNHVLLLTVLTKKSTRYGANIALVVFLVLGILVFVNILGKEYHWRKDVTRAGANSLSPQTLKLLADLKQDVKAMHFSKLQEKEKGESLLKNYAYHSKKFKYEFIDVDRQPTLTTSMGVKAADTVVLTLEGSSKRVPVEGATEEKVTNGLIKLLKQREQVVYFTVGHGEHEPGSDADPMGYGMFKAELGKQGYTVKELSLLNEGKVPADAAVLIVGGPRTAFFPKELEIISGWLASGGRAFLATDLDINENGLAKGSRQLAELLKMYGVTVSPNMLVDPTSRAANVEPQVLLGFSGSKDHPVTKDFAHSTVVANFLFPLTSHLSVSPNPSYGVTPLAVTTAQAWAESDWGSLKSGSVRYDQGSDFQGRMNLAVAIEARKPEADPAKKEEKKDEKPGMRAVAFANAIFATNNMLDKVGNRDLALNAVAWLSDDERFISIRASEDQDQLKQFSNSTLNLILLVTVFLIPLLTIAAGVTVWWRRSKL